MQRIRVMHVIGTLGHGGLEQGVLKVVRGLDPALFEQTICTIWSLDYMKLEKELRVINLARSPEKTGYIGYDLLKPNARVCVASDASRFLQLFTSRIKGK